MPFFQYKNHNIHYLQFGNGSELLIAIHGFADKAETYLALETALESKYTVLAIDLPFHGKTDWKNSTYTVSDIENVILKLAHLLGKKQVALMGHSMGSRLIMKVLPHIYRQVTHLYFLAPDGIRIKGLFNANLVPVWFRKWAKNRLERPEQFLKFSNFLYKRKWIKPIAHKFVGVHLSNARRRKRLFNNWISLTHFMTYPWKFASFLSHHQIPIDLFYGTKDFIIQPKEGKKFTKKVPHATLHILEVNHQMINSTLNAYLRNYFETIQK